MLSKILIPTDLSPESNSIYPHAVTLAQVFGSKLYMLHVMDPASLKGPERLEDFPRLGKFFDKDADAPDLPRLHRKVPVATVYRHHKSPTDVIIDFAKHKQVDLVAMASTDTGGGLAWWSAGRSIERVISGVPCSVLCMRGRSVKEKDWKRPRFKHILLLVDLSPRGSTLLIKVLPWVQTFNSMLHIFPLEHRPGEIVDDASPLREVSKLEPTRTNVLLFANPTKRTKNLMSFVESTPIDLIVMAPQTRTEFSNRFIDDILVRLLKVTESPILLLR
jgi:nucleotide-binding universal stress UspA family protein